ncbi:MAG: hypothetical protein ACFCUS_09395 [Rubrimonas sp.]|uniref:hypothetical protein n=1 Tax=Rubrimonas sp. TaxID=2036015 RepID=UPI002FDD2638
MTCEDFWTPAHVAAARIAARAAEAALRRGLHPERDPFALSARELADDPATARRREAFRSAHARATALADEAAAA